MQELEIIKKVYEKEKGLHHTGSATLKAAILTASERKYKTAHISFKSLTNS